MKRDGLVERVCRYNKAISDVNRMKMVKIVGSREPYTMKVSDIAEVLGISQPACTKHLKIMEEAGLFKRERVGNSVYYMLDAEEVERYRQDMYHAFDHASTPCPYDFQCDSCPVKDTCT